MDISLTHLKVKKNFLLKDVSHEYKVTN